MVLLKERNNRQDNSYRKENIEVNFFGAKIKRIPTKSSEEGLDVVYRSKRERWITGLLSFVCTLTLGFGTHFLSINNDLMSAKITKIECGDTNLLGCDERVTEDISETIIFKTLIPNWIEWMILFCAAAAILMIMIGGGMFLVGIGNDEMYTKAKTTITWAIVGLLVAMFSYAIVTIINNLAYPGT